MWICINMQIKSEAVSSICSREIVDLKILQSHWLWAISRSQKQDFSQHRIYVGTQKITIMQKSVYSICLFWNTVNFRILSLGWPHPFLTIATPKILKQLLFAWICTSMQKIGSFHQLIFQIQSIFESREQIGHTHF